MQQSLPYLSDSQSSVRLAAVRFIGESLPLAPSGQAWPRPCTALAPSLWPPQPPCAEPQPPPAPCHRLGLVAALLSATPHGCWWPLGQP